MHSKVRQHVMDGSKRRSHAVEAAGASSGVKGGGTRAGSQGGRGDAEECMAGGEHAAGEGSVRVLPSLRHRISWHAGERGGRRGNSKKIYNIISSVILGVSE